MLKRKFILIRFSLAFLAASFSLNLAFASEKIIQKEELSFEKCLKVIKITAERLSISPEISKKEDKERVAIFTLSDGSLKITCDGKAGLILVSSS